MGFRVHGVSGFRGLGFEDNYECLERFPDVMTWFRMPRFWTCGLVESHIVLKVESVYALE